MSIGSEINSHVLYIVYKITCLVNKKIYFGITSKSLRIRWKQHILQSISPKHLIHKAIRKYNQQNFVIKKIHCVDTFDKAKELETKYIKKFNTHYLDGYGYNMTYGGDGTLGFKFSKESIKKMSESHIGQIPWNRGKNASEETRRKIVLSKLGHKQTKETIEKRISHITKEYIITFPTGKEVLIKNLAKFSRKHNINSGHMVQVAKGKLISHKGFKCRYT